MLLEVHPVAIDDAGRLVIPAPLRKAFAPPDKVVLWRSTDGAYLDGADLSLLDRYAEKFEALPDIDVQREDFEYAFFAGAHVFKMDNGRITLPPALIAHAHLRETAAIAGLGKRFAVWDPDRLDARMKDAQRNAASVLSKLRGT